MKNKEVIITQKHNKNYYSFLTVFLLFSAIFLLKTTFFNVIRIIDYQTKLITLQTLHNNATNKQNQLKSEIDCFKSNEAYEAILRNNLKMGMKDDVLVIIVPKS